MESRAIAVLRQHVSAARLAKIESVVAQRTRWPLLVLENAVDPHNVAACLRTAEGLGLSCVHVIERHQAARINDKVTRDADKWLDVRRFASPQACVAELAADGATLIAADLSPGAEPLDKVLRDLSVANVRRLAVAMGHEHSGISPLLRRAAHRRFVLPMAGFVQSFNLSVSAAMTLTHCSLHGFFRPDEMSEQERQAIMLNYLFKSVHCTRRRSVREEKSRSKPRAFSR